MVRSDTRHEKNQKGELSARTKMGTYDFQDNVYSVLTYPPPAPNGLRLKNRNGCSRRCFCFRITLQRLTRDHRKRSRLLKLQQKIAGLVCYGLRNARTSERATTANGCNAPYTWERPARSMRSARSICRPASSFRLLSFSTILRCSPPPPPGSPSAVMSDCTPNG